MAASAGHPAVNASAEQIQRALACIHGGDLAGAESLCRDVLKREPRNFNAHQLLGHVALQRCDYARAAQCLATALSINAASAAVISNLAVALLALDRPRDALECCDGALVLQPQFPEASLNRGNALCALGRAAEGLLSYRQALAFAPRLLDAHTGCARALLALKRYEEALSSCEKALEVDERSIAAWILRGSALLQARRAEPALAAFDRALALDPESPEAHNNRGTALRDLRRPTDALRAYERAARLRPGFAEVWCNVANLSLDAGRYEEALGRCEQALRIQPELLEALNIKGTALRLLKRFEEAAATYEKIVARSPLYGQAQSHLLSVRASLADWSQRAERAAGIIARVAAGESASAPHAFLWICDSAERQFACARIYSAEQFPAAVPLWRGERYRHARPRIAYLSADFADHPVAHLIAGVIERHDRRAVETFGVSLQPQDRGGAMHGRMSRAFEHFEDVSDVSDRDVAAMLRAREIDIAVDLTGHTRGGRLGILAFRPAPLQVNYLGYAGSSGADYLDYVIADRATVPEADERFFSERIVRMPHSFLPGGDGEPIAGEAPRRPDLGLPEKGFVFCAFNNTYKIDPVIFDVWMAILRAAPHSLLWLRDGSAVVRANFIREAAARGVEPARLVFAPRVPSMQQHLLRYQRADLFLDTVPYGAHATARDALCAGLPVLTCLGGAFAGRVGGSLLTTLGFPELVTTSLDAYANRALQFAFSPGRLAQIRAQLAERVRSSPVFDANLYRRHLEAAYRIMWELGERGLSPRSFAVPAMR
jgi:predicted O-linked N-acetylglucosamine transferase (SPINDLY family)